MSKVLFTLLVACAFLLVAACSEDGSPRSTPSPTGRGSPTARPGATATITPTSSPTATPTSSPQVTPTATPTSAPTPRPTATPAASPLPISAPANLAAFFAQYQGMTIDWADCAYQPRTGIADCVAWGRYILTPAIVGQDISCSVGTVQERPIAVRCTSQEPLQTVYYAVP